MSQVEYGPLAEYYELINEWSVPYDDQAAFLVELLHEFGPRQPAPFALDIACGPGLLGKRLIEHGLRVVGIDLAEALLRQAAGKGRGHFVRADMRRLPFAGAFDLACCLLHTINYMTSDEDLADALACITAALKPGGVAAIDFIAYEPRREWKAKWRETVKGDGIEIVCRHSQVPDWRTMLATDRHTYTVHEEGRKWSVSGVDRLRITSAEEMKLFAQAAGLEPLAVCGKYDLNRGLGFDGGVLVVRKPRK